MNKHKNDHNDDDPLHTHLGDVEDEDGRDSALQDDGEVEVRRARDEGAEGPFTRGRGLYSRTVPDEEQEEIIPSKTKIKKQMHELRDLGKELTELSKDQLAQLDIPDSLRDAIREMNGINKFGAQRRQIQYIGKLMREVDPLPILAKLDTWKGKSQQHTAYMHLLERWRGRLMESDNALTELLSAHPEADAQRLRTLIRNAHKEIENNKPPKNYREIFQVLREIISE
jgi:ribosome-associated protein